MQVTKLLDAQSCDLLRVRSRALAHSQLAATAPEPCCTCSRARSTALSLAPSRRPSPHVRPLAPSPLSPSRRPPRSSLPLCRRRAPCASLAHSQRPPPHPEPARARARLPSRAFAKTEPSSSPPCAGAARPAPSPRGALLRGRARRRNPRP